MWYFINSNGKKQGPVSPENIQDLIENGSVAPNTLVWKTGMSSWSAICDTDLKDLLPDDLPPPLPSSFSNSSPPLPYQGSNSPQGISVEINQLETWFKVYWICLAAGIPLSIIIIGLFAVITSWVFSLMMLYKFWQIIQDGQARTTPEKAVGFSFIPFFNLYWLFVCFWGLAKDMNRYIAERDIRTPKINEELVLTYCILSCVSVIPYLGILTGIAALTIWIIILRAFKQSTVAILKTKFRSL
jgi:hypothetical protein